MAARQVTVHAWPQCGTQLDAEDDLLVIAVDTPPTPIRDTARRLVRTALGQVLSARLNCPAGSLSLSSAPGQPPRLAEHPDIHLSISHEPGLSLLAIHFAGPVGIDLLQMPENPVWQPEIPTLARDYLGPVVATRLAGFHADEQVTAFAEAWVRHEAGLKCQGIGLAEWSPAMERQLAACTSSRLELPFSYFGALATRAAPLRAAGNLAA